MRTCMYCGRELEKGEKCDCAQSKARRGEYEEPKKEEAKQNTNTEKKTDTQQKNDYSDPYRTKTSYKTGYAGGDNRFDGARERYKAKRAAKGNSNFKNVWQYIVRSLKSPIEAVTNPTHLGKISMLLISAAMGALLWLCVFFILRGGAVGPFKFIASAMGFGGGYKLILSILAAAASGAVGGVVMFFLYTGIFYLINKFLMRLKTPYWDFCVRLVSAWVPFTVICLIGTVLSILSPYTLIALVLCGAALTAVLTYEALKTEWYAFPPSKVVYSLLLGYFVFLTVMAHLLMIRV